jgi:nitrile hydratase subunit alpha
MSPHLHDHERSAAVSNRVKTLVARLENEGITTESELDTLVELFLSAARPENGYAIVARAWTDPGFKARLLEDANAAIASMGIDLSQWADVMLRVVENTQQNHNVIVCTLCSCYPIALLGPSPSWYKSLEYRARAVREPRKVLKEFGLTLPAETKIIVWDSTADARYMVLPMRPSGTEGYTEKELAALVTRNGLIGTAAL